MYEEVLTENENLASTQYKKLLVSKETGNDIKNIKELELLLTQFREAADSFDHEMIKNLIKKHVPEYTKEANNE
jgi:FlaA1/EpsC-like NDP-sugar epimerase